MLLPRLWYLRSAMGDGSAIEWTDATWNPVRGCVKISPGCKHCYAETFAERFRGVRGHPYEQGFDLMLVPDKLLEPAPQDDHPATATDTNDPDAPAERADASM